MKVVISGIIRDVVAKLAKKDQDRTDYDSLIRSIKQNIPKTHEIYVLGEACDLPVYIIKPVKTSAKKSVLITAGFHGEESAPCWGLLRYLEEGNLPKDINLTIIPVVNPSGFSRGTRYNKHQEISNQGFTGESELSIEGKLLKGSIKELEKAAKDGFLTLHENVNRKGYYFYLLSEKYSPVLRDALVSSIKPELELMPDGDYSNKEEGSYSIKDGCIFNHKDESFEYYLRQQNIPFCVTSETPIKVDFDKRVKVTPKIISTFLKVISES